jgi:dUTPase-like protein
VIKDDVILVTIDPAFARLLKQQDDLQAFLLTKRVQELDPDELSAFIRTQAFALMAEVVEATDETHWKPWSVRPDDEPVVISRERYISELADVYIFFMNLMLAGDVTTIELAQAVKAKQEKNLQRWLTGYNAKATKCPKCKRSYDDDGVTCYPGDKATGVLAMCSEIGEFVR